MNEEITQRMLRGDPSAFLPWAAEPLDRGDTDAIWARALTEHPLDAMVYVHLPYCVASCSFCMYFHRVTRDEDAHARVRDHILAEIHAFTTQHRIPRVRSAYVGGGTPTAMPIDWLAHIVSRLRASFRMDRSIALTVEAHPGTTQPDALRALARAGATRISMGLQTTDPRTLSAITRVNPSLELVAALVRAAEAAGLETNLDLVVGLPEQNQASFDIDIDEVMSLRPDTITLYRFWPTHKARGGDLRLEDVVGPASLIRWARRGYGAIPALARSGSSVLMRRGSALRNLRRWATSPTAGAQFYQAFGETRSHLIGFGPGAISHAWGGLGCARSPRSRSCRPTRCSRAPDSRPRTSAFARTARACTDMASCGVITRPPTRPRLRHGGAPALGRSFPGISATLSSLACCPNARPAPRGRKRPSTR